MNLISTEALRVEEVAVFGGFSKQKHLKHVILEGNNQHSGGRHREFISKYVHNIIIHCHQSIEGLNF